jgi:MFS transporter, FHS family, glucose/mannose:H+ symporter
MGQWGKFRPELAFSALPKPLPRMPALRIKISLFINYFLFAILLNSAGTVILQVQHYFGTMESSASMIELFKDFSLALTSFLVAAFITRIGYKNSMLFALALIAAACFILPSVKTLLAIKLLFAVAGASFALTKISVLGCIGLMARNEKEHISLMNFIESFFMMGIFAGYFIFSRYMDRTQSASGQWFNVYYLLGGLSVFAFILLLTAPLDESAVKITRAQPFSYTFSGMLQMILLPMVISFIVCAFLYVLVEQSIMSWLPTYNYKVLQLPAVISVQVTSALAAATALGRFVAAIMLKRWNWFFILTGGLAAAAVLVIVALFVSDNSSRQVTSWFEVPVAAFIFPMIGFFLAPVYPAINSVVLASLPRSRHGIMSGLIVICSALGGSFGSVITGFMFQYYGGKSAFYFSLIPMLLLVISFFIFERVKNNRVLMPARMLAAAA